MAWSNLAFWQSSALNTDQHCKRKRSAVSSLTKNGEWEFIPAPPSAAVCFPALVNAHSSSLWQLTDSPAPAPRMHQGCHESNTQERVRLSKDSAKLHSTSEHIGLFFTSTCWNSVTSMFLWRSLFSVDSLTRCFNSVNSFRSSVSTSICPCGEFILSSRHKSTLVCPTWHTKTVSFQMFH